MSRFLAVLARNAGLVVLVVVMLVAGYLLRAWLVSEPSTPGATQPVREAASPKPAEDDAHWWTCAMHPQIRLPHAGKCPICRMDLIPLSQAGGPRTFVTTPEARALMEVETSPVERRFVDVSVRLAGKLGYDETKLAYITAWVSGRVDRLYVDYTGVTVRQGDHMAVLYSPELLTTQEELLQAIKTVSELKDSDVGIVKETAQATVEAAREKLRLLGLKPDQIAEIEKRGTASDHITIYAPVGGIVVEKNVRQGVYVQTGMNIYTVADLSQLWVKLDAYESDLAWLRYGQKVEFTAEAYPGEKFVGVIAFIDPVVDDATRTVKVRVNLPNPAGKLKPEMFVQGVVHPKVAQGGKVIDADLAGKWISPMHPEIVKDVAGTCDICGMPLVRAESLGYVAVDESERVKPLVIPASAPLITGKRAVVYVELPGAESPTFEGREVELGPRAGDFYVVASGLKEGELVVTRGNFKIDSALQIQAKRSMMSPEGGAAPAAHHGGPPPARPAGPPETRRAPEAFQKQLGELVRSYFAASEALAADGFEKAAEATRSVAKTLDAVDMTLLEGDAHSGWMKELPNLRKALEDMQQAKDIAALRAGFALLSEELPVLIHRFGLPPGIAVYRLRCTMAFNGRGADWLQADKSTRNPYYGAPMLTCGDVVETLR